MSGARGTRRTSSAASPLLVEPARNWKLCRTARDSGSKSGTSTKDMGLGEIDDTTEDLQLDVGVHPQRNQAILGYPEGGLRIIGRMSARSPTAKCEFSTCVGHTFLNYQTSKHMPILRGAALHI